MDDAPERITAERLKYLASSGVLQDEHGSRSKALRQAADTIEAITAERDRLREALRIIKYSGEDGTQDQIAPEMWEFCIDTADDALGTLKETAE